MLMHRWFSKPRADVTWEETDAQWYPRLGYPTEAGVSVNADIAMKVSTVYRAVNVLANSVASIPLPVWRRLANGGKERDRGHYAYRILHDRPNNWQTSYRWRHMLMGHLLLRGNHYSQIVPGPNGFMDQLVPLHPDRTRVVDQLSDGRLLYLHTTRKGEERRINQEFMFHPRGFSSDGITGVSVIALMRDSVGLALAAEKHGARFLRQGSTLSGVLVHPKTLSEEVAKRIGASWQEAYGGWEKAGAVPVLEEGMQWHTIGMSNEDAQYLETRDFQVADLLRFIGVPGVLVGHADKTATYASAEQFFLSFVMHGVAPWAVNLQQEMTNAFIVDPEQHFVEFVLEGLLRGDIKTRYQAHQTAVLSGWKTRNEVRIEENMNPGDDTLDEFLQPSNMQPAGEEPANETTTAGPNNARPRRESLAEQQLRFFVTEAARRVVRRELVAINGRRDGAFARKGARARYKEDPMRWERWVRSFYEGHARWVAETLFIDLAAAQTYSASQARELLKEGARVTATWERTKVPLLVQLALMPGSSEKAA